MRISDSMAMRESASKIEILDCDWKVSGEALHELLADVADDDTRKSQVQHQAEAIMLLANHCKTGTCIVLCIISSHIVY